MRCSAARLRHRRRSGCAGCLREYRGRRRPVARRARCRNRSSRAARGSSAIVADAGQLLAVGSTCAKAVEISRIDCEGTISPSCTPVVLRQFGMQAGQRRHRSAGAQQPDGAGPRMWLRMRSANSAKLRPTVVRIRCSARAVRPRLYPTLHRVGQRHHAQGTLSQSTIRGTLSPGWTSTSSVEPPPMSKMIAGPSPSSSRM